MYRVKEDRCPGVAVRDAAQVGACCARCADRRNDLLDRARHHHLSRLRWRDALLARSAACEACIPCKTLIHCIAWKQPPICTTMQCAQGPLVRKTRAICFQQCASRPA